MIGSFDEVIDVARERGPRTVAVAVAQDPEVLAAVSDAEKQGIANVILVGDRSLILKEADQSDIDISNCRIIDERDKTIAAAKAVELVSSREADMVMKGLVDTSIILKAVLNESIGLRTGNVLSHVALFEVPGYDRLFIVTDAAMNIAPNVEQKVQIIGNAITVANALGLDEPKVAVVCAVEKVNSKMPATVDAQELVQMNSDGRIQGCVIGGPFALDNSISEEAAKHKGIDHAVAGRADILLMPDIEAGNVLYKSMVYFAKAKNAGIVVGAKAPIVLTSRADSHQAKFNSIALGVLMAGR